MVSLTNIPPTLKFEDAEAIADNVPEVKRVAQLQNAFNIDVQYRDRTDSPAIFGVSANWLELHGDQVAQGTFITTGDVQSLARVAVLGSDVIPILFPGQDPIAEKSRSKS